MPLTIPVENWALRKSPRSSMGSRSRRSCQTNSAPRTAASTNRPTINAEPQPVSAPKVMADRSAAIAGKKIASPVQSKRTRANRFWLRGTSSDRGEGADHADGDVDEEDEAPAAGGQQQAADRRAQGEPERLGRPLEPDGLPERSARHHEHDDGQAVRLQHGRPDGLQGAEAAQRGQVGCQAAQHRGAGEDDEAVDVEELAPPHVGEATDRGDGRHQHQEVRQADPGDGPHRGVEGALQRRQGHRDDGRVELAHERADAHGGHGEPRGVRLIPDDLGPPRLDEQAVPGPRPRSRRPVPGLAGRHVRPPSRRPG